MGNAPFFQRWILTKPCWFNGWDHLNFNILGLNINDTNYDRAVNLVSDWASSGNASYICCANVHMVMEAYDSPDFCQIVNTADIVTPDGIPLVWIMRSRGAKNQERVYGPHLMIKALKMAENEGIPVGFIGGQPQTLEKLVKRVNSDYPSLRVAYYYSPPFRDLTLEEDQQIVEKIRISGARIFFVGLGCPKQEYWMHAHRGKIKNVMIGVGAAFDFYAGTKKQAPSWMQNAGLEWMFRLFQEPERLWKRYLFHNLRFVILVLFEQFCYLIHGKQKS